MSHKVSAAQLFEATSGLKVNFNKSQVLVFSVAGDWLNMVVGVLHCKTGKVSFKYLGLRIGVDIGKKITWVLVLEKVRKRLLSWNNKHLSMGGRITLLKSVLLSLPHTISCSFAHQKVLSVHLNLSLNTFFGEGETV